MRKSAAICLHGVVSCLNLLQTALNFGPGAWAPQNPEQEKILRYLEALKDDLPALADFMKSVASKDVDVVNNFLANAGYAIQLDHLTDPNAVAVASILDVMMEWPEIANRVFIKPRGQQMIYPGVDLRSYMPFAKAGEPTIIRFETKSGIRAYVSIPEAPLEGLDIYEEACRRTRLDDGQFIYAVPHHAGVHLPMIDMDVQPDISWLKGLKLVHDPEDGRWLEILQALQQNKLRLNEQGARAESATAMWGTLKGVMPLKEDEPIIIDQPYLFWVRVPNILMPVFAAYVAEDTWKNPGSLE